MSEEEVGRCLGLDVGAKTIGVALSDALGMAAHPLEVIARAGTDADALTIRALVLQHDVRAVVVGLPLDLKGKEGHRARRVRVFIDALRAGLPSGVEVVVWDERFSTVAVERVLVDANVSRQRRKQVIDKQAAAYILQGWLDHRPTKATDQ